MVAALHLRQISLQAELSERKDKEGERAYLCEILLCRVKLYRRNSYVKARGMFMSPGFDTEETIQSLNS